MSGATFAVASQLYPAYRCAHAATAIVMAGLVPAIHVFGRS